MDPNLTLQGNPRCIAITKQFDFEDAHRCKRAARPGSCFCGIHSVARDALDKPRRPVTWVITTSMKPYQPLPGGGYRKRVVGRLFYDREQAEEYLRLCWHHIMAPRHGRRPISACVERASHVF